MEPAGASPSKMEASWQAGQNRPGSFPRRDAPHFAHTRVSVMMTRGPTARDSALRRRYGKLEGPLQGILPFVRQDRSQVSQFFTERVRIVNRQTDFVANDLPEPLAKPVGRHACRPFVTLQG